MKIFLFSLIINYALTLILLIRYDDEITPTASKILPIPYVSYIICFLMFVYTISEKIKSWRKK